MTEKRHRKSLTVKGHEEVLSDLRPSSLPTENSGTMNRDRNRPNLEVIK
jgi:hypothetical protein